MSEDNGVSAAEAGMLATNPSDPPGVGDSTESIPAPEQAAPVAKKKTLSGPSANSEKTVQASSKESTQSDLSNTDLNDSGLVARFMKFSSYIQYTLIVILVITQVFAIINISLTGHKISSLEKTIVDMKAELVKREAEHEKRFAEALHEKGLNDMENRKRSVASETLNRLRNGLPEQRLVRKKDGDWYVKGDAGEAIGNSETIEVLNNAYAVAKSTERSGQIVPPHTGNAVVVLKPDGKGGTIVKTAYDFIVK